MEISTTLVTTVVVALAAAVSSMFTMLISSKNEQIKDANDRAKSYEQMAETAVSNLEIVAQERLLSDGKPAYKVVAPVIPESNSPTTMRQRQDAVLATKRARLVAATESLGLPARKEEPAGDE